MQIVKSVVNYLIDHNLTISVCESLTGGLLASKIVEIPNSSKIFSLGIVTYSNEMKEKFLEVNSDTIKKYDVVSKEVVSEMVIGLSKQIKSDIYISTSGYAGPSGLDVGKVCFGIMYEGMIYSYQVQFNDLNRNEIREETVSVIFKELSEILGLQLL